MSVFCLASIFFSHLLYIDGRLPHRQDVGIADVMIRSVALLHRANAKPLLSTDSRNPLHFLVCPPLSPRALCVFSAANNNMIRTYTTLKKVNDAIINSPGCVHSTIRPALSAHCYAEQRTVT